MNAQIGFLSVEFLIPGAQSLKEKRWVLKSLKDRIRGRFNVSVSEVDGHDKWQRSVVGVCMLGTVRAEIDGALQHVLSLIGRVKEVEIVRHQMEFL